MSTVATAPALSSLIDIFAFYSRYSKTTGRATNSRSDGKEWHGSCPNCGGTDRFSFWQSGRFSCSLRASGCGIHGSNPYWFLRDVEGLTHRQACEDLDIDPSEFETTQKPVLLPLSMTRDEAPNKIWMESAEAFVWRAQRYLWTENGKRALDYLRGRGFTDETLKLARIGFCPGWFSDILENWGLAPEQTEKERLITCKADFSTLNGSNQSVQALLEDGSIVSQNALEIKVPRGIVIPWFVDYKVWKLSIRREDKTYFQVLGSSDCLYNIDSLRSNTPIMLFEGEFDALSAQQEAGNIAACIATGSASKGRTSPLVARLKKASHVLVAFDTDEAGHSGAQEWLKILKNAVRWQPWSHDCNDMLQQKMPVRMWAEMGIKAATIELAAPETVKDEQSSSTALAVPTPPELHRDAIQTYLQLNPWALTGDRGLPRFCSVCKKEQAVWWGAGVTPYCDKHWPGERREMPETL